MILIPEIETVVILTPRTGSGSLKKAIAAAYPESMQIYRHMEADGVPHGYDRWRKLGIVRHPVDRLWSLYKFLKNFDGPYAAAYIAEQRASVGTPFSQWIVENRVVFTSPYDRDGSHFYPRYAVRHPLPETRKSQFFYLRPDLGTKIFRHENMDWLANNLLLKMGQENKTEPNRAPPLDAAAAQHIERFFSWDLSQGYSVHQEPRKPHEIVGAL